MSKLAIAFALAVAVIAPASATDIDWYTCANFQEGWQKRTIKAIDLKQSIVKFDDDSCVLAETWGRDELWKEFETWREGDEILFTNASMPDEPEMINQSRGNIGLGASRGD
jgi:hypothetical protein